ncbi:YlbF family regulator [Akkermansiaceae bacterium]|nr:YlbF family regulator [Akkermansiaceae bacterium]
MSIISDESPIVEKTKELCGVITENAEYKSYIAQIELFLNDDQARTIYQSLHEQSEQLREKQKAGVMIGEGEIEAFKEARTLMGENEVIMNFMAAQDELQSVQNLIGKYVGMSLELGRVPDEDDFAAMGGGGCCGGGCGEDGGGCGDGGCDDGSCDTEKPQGG